MRRRKKGIRVSSASYRSHVLVLGSLELLEPVQYSYVFFKNLPQSLSLPRLPNWSKSSQKQAENRSCPLQLDEGNQNGNYIWGQIQSQKRLEKREQDDDDAVMQRRIDRSKRNWNETKTWLISLQQTIFQSSFRCRILVLYLDRKQRDEWDKKL